MIYLELNDDFLTKHEVYINDESTLKKNLFDLKGKTINDKALSILNYIIGNLKEIVCCSFENLIVIQKEYVEMIFSLGQFDQNDITAFKVLHNGLSKHFLAAYSNFTEKDLESDWNSHTYIKQLNQPVCPYCNANFINAIQGTNVLKGAKSRGMPDLDHFLPKTLYPIFAVTLSNLIPCCIYCNQRFKGAFETSFNHFFSPFDKEIKDSFKFKINYNDNSQNAFNKLQEYEVTLSDEQNFYFDLISEVRELNKSDKKILEIIDSLNETLRFSRISLNNLHQEVLIGSERLKHQQIDEIKVLLEELLNKANEYINVLEQGSNTPKNEMITQVNLFFNKIIQHSDAYFTLHDKFLDFTGIKNIRQIKNCLSNLRKNIDSFVIKINNIYHYDEFKELSTDQRGFVDSVLGESTNYSIEVIANDSLSEEIKKKVYFNAALFQIEAVYNQYKPYINNKIKQSYIINGLYLKQLNKQFPDLFSNDYFENITNTILVNYENQGNEILGKFLSDVILPTVKEQQHIDKLRLLDLD